MPEVAQDFTLVALLRSVTALAWLGSALVSLAAYRTFRQQSDLWWLIVFAGLTLVRAADAYVAMTWSQNAAAASEHIDLVAWTATFGVRMAVIELALAILAFFTFRRPRATF
jgi:hypothetical protein